MGFLEVYGSEKTKPKQSQFSQNPNNGPGFRIKACPGSATGQRDRMGTG